MVFIKKISRPIMIIRHLQSVKVLLVLEFRPVIVTFTTVTNKPKIIAAVLIRLVKTEQISEV